MREEEFDIHHSSRKLKNAVRYLNACSDICTENKRKILEFQAWLGANGFSLLRQVFYVQHLTWIARMLRKPFDRCTKQNLLELMKTVNAENWSEWTKRGYSVVVKKFWRWLKDCSDGEDPPETKWIKIKNIKESSLLPDDLLTKEDVLALLKVAEHTRDKAFLLTLDECAGRIQEILTLVIGRVAFDEYGAVIHLKGNKGERRVRLITSASALANWINHHPLKNQPDAPVWVNIGTTNHGEPLDYASARKLLKELGSKAGITKRVNPYTFRHSTITHMANLFTEAQLCEYFGWKQGSQMPRIYVHLSGRDVDKRLLEIHGLAGKEKETPKLAIKVCPRCELKNPPAGKFCSRCGSALDLKAALEADRRIERAEELLETLLTNPEVKAFLVEKIRKLDLTGTLA